MIDRIDPNDSEVNPVNLVNPVKKRDSVAMNEAETRAEKIDPAGQAAGCGVVGNRRTGRGCQPRPSMSLAICSGEGSWP